MAPVRVSTSCDESILLHSVVVYDCAEKFLDRCDNPSRIRLLDACDRIGMDPYIDGVSKFAWPASPAVFRLWSDGEYWIIYRNEPPNTVHIYNMGKEGRDQHDFRC